MVGVKKVRFGWLGIVQLATIKTKVESNGLWEPQFELVEPPTFWRPDARQAYARAERKAKRMQERDLRERKTSWSQL